MKMVGERRALASIVFAFWFVMFLMNALMGPAPFAPVMYAMAGTYGLAFFSVVAGYFWARWYAVGVALFGVILGAVALWINGFDYDGMILGGSHLLAATALWGGSMAEMYDGRPEWREKFHMDENAVHRLGRAVIRAGLSLPLVLAYSLQPKPGAIALIAGVLTVAGFTGLLKMRGWSVLALGAAGTLLVGLGFADYATSDLDALTPMLGGSLLVFATVPFLRGLVRRHA